MRVHILGICGTFMGSLAVLAKELGYSVSGSDQNVYPPMSTQLEQVGITLSQGYDPAHIEALKPDLVVIGNACSRGNPAVEYVLEHGLAFMSGPAWLAEHVLRKRWVLAVAGTHGKTTTTSMLSWILDYAGLAPGYLIGGVPKNFEVSARLGGSDFFVIEADEYDSAFFDKRSKFIHYLPRTLIMGNLEFDHADIFRSLDDIQLQFHHLTKTIPATGRIVAPCFDANLDTVFARGLWSELERFGNIGDAGAAWQVRRLAEDGSALELVHGADSAMVYWRLVGQHNAYNAIAAAAAAHHVGVPLHVSAEALSCFEGVKRRLELLGEPGGVRLYDDFAHHPTAIATTLAGLRATMRQEGRGGRLFAVIEARSNTMKMGYHQNTLAASLAAADTALWYKSAASQLDLDAIATAATCEFHALDSTQAILDWLLRELRAGDHVVIMSNGGFEGLQQRLSAALHARATSIPNNQSPITNPQ
ncbi:MAG: UDP-N-acetylmuramate:L-alanyl-gamma-D-glutamyl-meso-diaminopimelate ligase [Pseudomonadales bacterium]|jgi:UDP-N-acetylmuramate: L-alanyl-gamma-D-glutamyl-meso-diaminopimelate ligase|nr:UDP-N-acetylmuramate:L-alanyl-gamma-D-glutamyl-meso-diaminopimelate ligase [Pseudomonadales bacterium]